MPQRIINLMPPHDVYIEPFLGDAAVMRMKRPAAVNIGIDVDAVAPGLAWLASQGMATKRAHWSMCVGDALCFLDQYRFTGRELVYCDPPYLMSTRSGRRMYRYELDTEGHRQLLRVLLELPCMVMLSGYWSELYAQALATPKWSAVSYEVMTRGGRMATEWLWMNFAAPLVLHDYSQLGAGFRERERIKRKKARWTAKLRKMPALERQAIISAIADLADSGEWIQSPPSAVVPAEDAIAT